MKRLLIILFFAINMLPARASHIVGGDMSLQYISGDQYFLSMRVFRDCSPVRGFIKPLLDDSLYIGMFDKADNRLVAKFEMYLSLDDTPKFVGANCINVPTGCTEIGHYYYKNRKSPVAITLDPLNYSSKAGYYFSWERCCRNTVIKNILVGQPPGGNTGECLLMEIPPLTVRNSTPFFNKDPLTLLCTFNPFSFNYDVTDADGDSLAYSLITPLKGTTNSLDDNDPSQPNWPILASGPYAPVSWAPGYGLYSNIMDGAPDVKIDSHTGELTVTPTREGIYVVAIEVREYRHLLNSQGKLVDSMLGTVTRELQFTVSSCINTPAPIFSADVSNTTYGLGNGTFTAYATDSFCLPVVITDNSKDSIYFSFSGDIFGPGGAISPPYATLKRDSGVGKITQQLCWQTTCNDASTDTYFVDLIARNNGCPIPQIRTVRTKIVISPPPVPAPPEVFCGNVANQNSYTISWSKTSYNKYFTHYILVRINPDGTQKSLDTITRYTTLNYYTDTTAYNNDSKIYQYVMYGFNVCDTLGTPSYPISTDPSISKYPKTRSIITVTVDTTGHLMVEWEKATEPNFKEYTLLRKPTGQNVPFAPYMIIEGRNDTIFRDPTVDVATQSFCYKLMVENECGYKSDTSYIGCSIVLTPNVQPFENHLSWNSYYDWKNGVSQYEIFRKEYTSPMASFDFVNASSESLNTYTDDTLNLDVGIYYYKVVAHEAGSQVVSVSNTVKMVQAPVLWIPNAFTPNGDNLNDLWNIVPAFVHDYHLRVYNRWGELVYSSDDRHQQWNGTFLTTVSADNVFIYQVQYTGWDFSNHYQSGNVTLVR